MVWGIILTGGTIGCATVGLSHMKQGADYADLSEEDGDYWDDKAQGEGTKAALWIIGACACGGFATSHFNKALDPDHKNCLLNFEKGDFDFAYPEVNLAVNQRSAIIRLVSIRF